MKHSVVFKQKDTYASFPLLQYEDGILTIGFFTAPKPDHMGIFEWKVMRSADNGETWGYRIGNPHYDWPALSPRERSDRFTATLTLQSVRTKIATGSCGFRTVRTPTGEPKIAKSKGLFLRSSSDNWKTATQKAWEIPNTDVVLTFPRHLQVDNLILVPVYIVLKNGLNRALVWRSDDCGENWKLYNMFPNEINANEVAFVNTSRGILAHVRSDTNPFIMESWSNTLDGIIWTYPMNICALRGGHTNSNISTVAGGPSHLLKLHDGRIIDAYGYRFGKMGIRAIVSEDEGVTWNRHIVLRDDGGYSSSLHKKRWLRKMSHPGNDVGYPVSVQLKDGSILTAYYITCEDGVTHIATTKWEV